MQDSSFSVIIKNILSEGSFLNSDIYFTRKILKLPEQAEITRQDRQDAYIARILHQYQLLKDGLGLMVIQCQDVNRYTS